jgi:hypothetical protein
VTPLQGLYALNGPLLNGQARSLAERVRKECGDNAEASIERAYWLLYSRGPSDREKQLGLAFLDKDPKAGRASRWVQYAHVLLASNEFLYVE